VSGWAEVYGGQRLHRWSRGVPETRWRSFPSAGLCPPPGWGGGVGGGVSLPSLVACPLPVPPAEVGFIRLRPANRWPNSGKPEFGCKRGRGRCGASDGVIINTVGGH